jgi:hypothetical protein
MRDLGCNYMEVYLEVWRELERSSERIGKAQAKIPTWHLPKTSAVLPLEPAYPVPKL